MRTVRLTWCPLFTLLLGAMGCGKGEAPAACADLAGSVAESLSRWRDLDDKTTYWYDEENCAPNSSGGLISRVQVDAAGAQLVGMRIIDMSECEVQVNRYESFTPLTLEALYADCKALVMRECDTVFETDDDGIVRTCSWDGDDTCFDNCGKGFHLRQRGFGRAPLD